MLKFFYMISVGIFYGLALIVTGLYGFFESGGASFTALIPAFLGAPIFLLSLASLNQKFLKIGMHINVVIALAGFGATAKDTISMLLGKESENQLAIYSKSITCILSLIFIIISVRYFINNRKLKAIQ